MKQPNQNPPVQKTKEEWKRQLTPHQYKITREGGTEQPHSNEYHDFFEEGTYYCICCSNSLFSSETKFKSLSGWPSFYDVIDRSHVITLKDTIHGLARTEVRCARCNAHLGHVFEDGPQPTGLRYCINSAALQFKPND